LGASVGIFSALTFVVGMITVASSLISRLETAAAATSPGTAQVSVCDARSASLSAASNAATSRTGNSAVASLSTSDLDAPVST
jgi:hypothetical protein